MYSRLSIYTVVVVALWIYATVILCPVQSCFGASNALATKVLSSVKTIQIPAVKYRVSIVQIISDNAASAGGNALGKGQDSYPTNYGFADFKPGEGLKRVRVEKKNGESELPTPTVMVDLGIFLRELETCDDTIDSVMRGGSPHYLISGRDAQGTKEISVWVDRDSMRVNHLDFSMMGQRFAEIDFDYENRINGYWLPTEIRVHHFTDETRVILKFTNYNFLR